MSDGATGATGGGLSYALHNNDHGSPRGGSLGNLRRLARFIYRQARLQR
jgi:hypothetical protein